jgi:hypothetical protein
MALSQLRQWTIENSSLVNVLLMVVLIAVTGFYAWLTYKILKQQQLSTNLQHRPMIRPRPGHEPAQEGQHLLVLSNVGQGPAIEVRVTVIRGVTTATVPVIGISRICTKTATRESFVLGDIPVGGHSEIRVAAGNSDAGEVFATIFFISVCGEAGSLAVRLAPEKVGDVNRLSVQDVSECARRALISASKPGGVLK